MTTNIENLSDNELNEIKAYEHLWRLSDGELFNLWLNIHNAREAYKHETI